MSGPRVSFAGFVSVVAAFFLLLSPATAQTAAGTINGTVVDPSGAVVPGATVTITSPVTAYKRSTTADAAGAFSLPNLAYSSYVLLADNPGFSPARLEITVNSAVPQVVKLTLAIASNVQTVTVDAPADLVESDTALHTDIDRSMIDRLPLESASSQLSSIVTLASPGVSADSNGLMHGLGDHAENSFDVDGQQITDQQSKVFSNQVPASAVQSIEVIDGAPPAEYGGKTSLVVKATTRSGQGVTTPTGSLTASYGSFGSANVSADLAYGSKLWGNFIAVDGLQTGRFLDAPEFRVFHDKGNEENFFDRADRQFTSKDSMHLDFQYTRSWFQTPNSFDTQYGWATPGNPLHGTTTGPTDQRSKIETIDIAPTYTRTIDDNTVFNTSVYFRRDGYRYYPSNNPLDDLGPPNLQQESVAQFRSLANAGIRADVSYVKGVNNVKVGGTYTQTFLRENDSIAVVSPTLNAPCMDASGNPLPGFRTPSQCTGANSPNPAYNAVLAPYDATRGGAFYTWHGHTDVKQLALYAQDSITAGNWLINAGLRGDIYNGLTIQREAQPRLGLSYSIKKTGTVLRASYARTQETPFNENLVLSSQGCDDPVLNAIFSTVGPCISAPFNPGFRNEIHAGFQQAMTTHFVLSGEYIWKYTHNAYDFSVFGATPITFPIEWHNSKIPGFALTATLTPMHGFSARVNMSSVAARFFNPQLGGIGATPGAPGGYAFRIDHDERFNQTTHVEYALPFKKSLYVSLNWRFDSGQVAASTPCYNVVDANSNCNPANGGPSITINGQPGVDLRGLTDDQQFQAGLACNGVKATWTTGFTQCLVSQLTSDLVRIPGPNSEDDDRNPQRIAPRNVFDLALGDDDLAHFGAKDRYKVGARLTAINLTTTYALYNFLSTFSGTHYLSPRAVTGELSLHF